MDDGRVIRKLKAKKLLPESWNNTLKQLRKTGANVLEKSNEHAQFCEMVLDHVAVSKRHYLKSGESVPKFDAAKIKKQSPRRFLPAFSSKVMLSVCSWRIWQNFAGIDQMLFLSS